MAEALQREYSLPVIKVSVAEVDAEPGACLELVVNEQGRQLTVGRRAYPLSDFGFVGTTEEDSRGPDLEVPPGVSGWIGEWVHRELLPRSPNGVPALWLHLVKPYGALGAVPWERSLQPVSGLPFLRLPDALPEPERPISTFDLALCATAPSEEGRSTATAMVPAVAHAVARGVGDRLRLHVFADVAVRQELEDALRSLPAGEAHVYPPPRDSRPSRSPFGDSPWLNWIREATGGGILDAVHFIAYGAALGTDGALVTARSPDSSERRFPRTLPAGEMRGFLPRVGALMVGFTTPHDRSSIFGARRFVDDLGALRAGPVFLHEPSAIEDTEVLTDVYRLLSEPGAGRPPADAALILFVQPREIAGIHPRDVRRPFALTSGGRSEAMQDQFRRSDTPLWVAAAERFLEERECEVVRFRESLLEQRPTPAQLSYFAGVETALAKIRTVLDKHAARPA